MEWEFCRIKDVLAVRDERCENNGTYPLASLTIENGLILKPDRYIREFLVKSVNKEYKVICPDDIAFNPMNLRWGAICVSKLAQKVIASPVYQVLSVKKGAKISLNFIENFFQTYAFKNIVNRFAEGTLIERTGVGIDDFMQFPIPVPSRDEQYRISNTLAAINDNINKTKKAIEQIQALKQGLLSELFAECFRGKHAKMPIRDLLLFCQYGLNKPLTDDSTGVAVLRMTNIVDAKVDTQKLKYAALTADEEKEYLLKDGDVLFNRTNSRDLVGKVSIFKGKAKVAFASYLLRLRVNPEKANPDWLNYYLNSPLIQTLLRSMATPGVSQSNINAQAMQAIKLNVPDIKTQEKSVGLLKSLDERIETETTQKAMLENIMLSLSQVLLTGKVRVKA